MKYLLQAIESRRQCVKLSDPELTKLLTDVQRARDDRSMLVESLERLLQDLRAQSHAAAFLTRVNKRDAPDYYDVIKNPMDLSLMLKNVKSGKYRTKESFRRDLDLIWDNCLIYNSEPSHPLRVSANLMRKRSHDLLSYIQDSNDVKSALSDWVANHTNLTVAQAKALQKGDLSAIASSNAAAAAAAAEVSSQASTSATPLPPPPPSVIEPAAVDGKADGTGKEAGKSSASHPDGEGFENRAAILVASGVSLAETAVEERRRGERDEWALSAAIGEDWQAEDEAGPSGSSSRLTQPIFEAQDEEAEVDNIVRSLAQGRSTSLVSGGSIWPPADEAASSSNPSTSSLSSAQRIDVMLPKLPASRLVQPRRPSEAPSKRKAAQPAASSSAMVNGEQAQPKRRKAADVMRGNIATLKRMKRLKDKFDILDYCLDNEQPLPSRLLLDSDDEDDEKAAAQASGSKRPRLNGTAAHAEAGPSNPYPRISLTDARSSLKQRIALIIGNAGFEAAQSRTTDILAGVAETFLLSLGRTLRLYTDRYGTASPSTSSPAMTPETLILHTLHSTSRMGTAELDKYISEDTVRYQVRLEELKRKLEASWKDRIAIGEEKLMTEEDARFFGEESEDLVAGNLPSALDDDFFGFKALGLDSELGMANLSVPARLLQRRGPAGRRGLGGDQAGGRGGAGEAEQAKDPFPPPKPFVPLSEASLPAQIGLLRPFYQDLLLRRGHRRGTRGGLNGEAGEGEDEDEEDEDEDEDEEAEGALVLSDEEQERTTRYKVPPTGKMPRREFWRPGGGATAKRAGAASAAAPTKGSSKASGAAEKAGSAATGDSAPSTRGGRGGGRGGAGVGRGRGRKRGGKAAAAAA